MNTVRARAPGKLLLTGEYAVLDGAPALVVAVDREVRVAVSPSRAGLGCLSAVPLGIDRTPFRVDDGRAALADGTRLGVTADFLGEALRTLGEPVERLLDLDIAIDSSALFERGREGAMVKLGLGSSAAVAAALAVALETLIGQDGREEPAERLSRWLPVYRRALSSRASGADLAAAFAGGLIEYAAPDGAPRLARHAWPVGLGWVALWVGQPASTEDFVARFEAWKREDPDAGARLVGLAARARSCAAARDDARALIDAAREYATAIDELGQAMGREVVTPEHRKLARLAERMGSFYKPCGAGGGDLGLALDDDPDRLRAFAAGASRLGAVPVHLSLSEQGAGTMPASARSGAGD